MVINETNCDNLMKGNFYNERAEISKIFGALCFITFVYFLKLGLKIVSKYGYLDGLVLYFS